ncbi:MAG: sulfur oxidation c-type cytochrome SoxA [Betaproteobacteria bacterium]
MKRHAAILAAAAVLGVGAPGTMIAGAARAQAIATIPDVFTRPDKGNCIACHQVPGSLGRSGGDVGPPLSGARMRELGAAKLREIVEDPMKANPDTAMPPFGRHRILDAAELTRIVQFLQALPDDAPPAVAPAAEGAVDTAATQAVLERGRTLWLRKFKDKRSLAGCFPNGGRRIAAAYPQYDPRVKRVVTLEMAINQCLKVHHEDLYDAADPETMGAVVAYVRSLSNGQKINVRIPAAAQARFDEGKRLYVTRMGQRNFACASCHVQAAGKRFGESTLAALEGQATGGPWVRNGRALTLQARMRECLERMGAAPFPAGSDELNQLEYYITYQSNGMPLKVPRRER